MAELEQQLQEIKTSLSIEFNDKIEKLTDKQNENINELKMAIESLHLGNAQKSRELSSPLDREADDLPRSPSRAHSRASSKYSSARASRAVSPSRGFSEQGLPRLIQHLSYLGDLQARGKLEKASKEKDTLREIVGPSKHVMPLFEGERDLMTARIGHDIVDPLKNELTETVQNSLAMALNPYVDQLSIHTTPELYRFETQAEENSTNRANYELARKQIWIEIGEKIRKPSPDLWQAIQFIVDNYDNKLTHKQTLACILTVVSGTFREKIKQVFRNATAEDALNELVRSQCNLKTMSTLQSELDAFKFVYKDLKTTYENLGKLIDIMYPTISKEERTKKILQKSLECLPSPVNTQLRQKYEIAMNRHLVAPRLPPPDDIYICDEAINLMTLHFPNRISKVMQLRTESKGNETKPHESKGKKTKKHKETKPKANNLKIALEGAMAPLLDNLRDCASSMKQTEHEIQQVRQKVEAAHQPQPHFMPAASSYFPVPNQPVTADRHTFFHSDASKESTKQQSSIRKLTFYAIGDPNIEEAAMRLKEQGTLQSIVASNNAYNYENRRKPPLTLKMTDSPDMFVPYKWTADKRFYYPEEPPFKDPVFVETSGKRLKLSDQVLAAVSTKCFRCWSPGCAANAKNCVYYSKAQSHTFCDKCGRGFHLNQDCRCYL